MASESKVLAYSRRSSLQNIKSSRYGAEINLLPTFIEELSSANLLTLLGTNYKVSFATHFKMYFTTFNKHANFFSIHRLRFLGESVKMNLHAFQF